MIKVTWNILITTSIMLKVLHENYTKGVNISSHFTDTGLGVQDMIHGDIR